MLINHCHKTNERVHNTCGCNKAKAPEKSQLKFGLFTYTGMNRLVLKTRKEKYPGNSNKN